MSSQMYDYNQIQDYLTTLVPPRPAEMLEMERYAEKNDFPIIGPVAGFYCYQLARLSRALTVFEMGSGYGYSTAWFAKAVRENLALQPGAQGSVQHVVWDQTLSDEARGHLEKLGLADLVQFHIAEATATLRRSPGTYDLVFCDIDKHAYPDALDAINEKTHPGSLLIIDNMLWYGRIFDPANQTANTQGVREFTRRVTTSPDWIASLSPLRDGLIVAYKQPHGWPSSR